MRSHMSGWRLAHHVWNEGNGVCTAEANGGVRKANIAAALQS